MVFDTAVVVADAVEAANGQTGPLLAVQTRVAGLV